ncbi:MAG TPA: ATP-dependent protease, Lon family [Clostridiales bacterium]|nr:ATP-dependent protease, Lon family [Clostridiales bacterium]
MLGRILGRDTIEQSMEEMGLEERVLTLHRLVFKNDQGKQAASKPSDTAQISLMVREIEEGVAEMMARRAVENNLEKQVIDLMEKRQQQYLNELKLEIITKKNGPENAHTLKKFADIEKLEYRKLSKQGIELMRPSSTDEIIGQDRAVKALISKLATPYPQHVLIYGPPGVGKTTAARLVLEMAKKMPYTPFPEDAAFVEVDGTTLRWDPREITNPLLGSVHDPIYQGSKRDLADSGIPEPKIGLVTEAHCGVLFIDEIGELDFFLQNKLLKVMEDKRVYFDSAYYDPDDENTPKYIKKLFEEGAPADFILIGATTRHPSEINPALRSRCAEVFFEPLAPDCIQKIVRNAAKKIGVELEQGVDVEISQYTMEGRKAVNILMDAYGMALFRNGGKGASGITITRDDLAEVIQISRLQTCSKNYGEHRGETGRIYGLGISGYLGSVIEFEAVAFDVGEEGKGTVRFNETAGSMAKDAVFNAATVIRRLTGEDISRYDIHVNAVGGGKIDGPSAGAAMVLLILSAMKGIPIWQDMAITGEISLQGKIKPVGGVFEKVCGAKQAGMKKVIIPRENLNDVPPYLDGIQVIPAETIEEAMKLMFTRGLE